MTFYLRYFQAAFLIAIAVMVFVASPAQASPYDAFSTGPGDEIRNEISVTWGNPGSAIEPIVAHDTFSVEPFNTPGTLRAFEYDPSGKAFDVSPTRIGRQGENGPFAPAPAPVDGAGNPIPLSSPVPLRETDRILKGATVFVSLDNPGLNFLSGRKETAIVKITDSSTGDTEYLEMTETGADTGVFIGYFRTLEGSSVENDGILNTHAHARIDATYTDPWGGNRSLENRVLVGPIDPYGTVFDSRTGLPIDGVRVTLIDDATGAPATVYGDDLVSSYPSTIVTGSTVTDSAGQTYPLEKGQYRFPFVNLGAYHLQIEAPVGYVAPSLVEDETLQALPNGPFELSEASRLESFKVTAGPPIRADVPLDSQGFITVTRTGSSDELELGDYIQFTITVGSNLPASVKGTVHDHLPIGLRMLPDTLLVNGATPATSPLLAKSGRDITFADVLFPAKDTAILTYVAQVTAQARENALLTSTSTARADRLMANTATHDLGILPTFQRDSDVLLGQVYATGCEAKPDPDLDLSGIRVMLEDGHFAQTDKDGRFTIRSVSRGAHVVALDPLSVPRGFEPVLCSNTTQKAGSAVSRFIEARGGFSRQVFFHLSPAKFYDNPDPIAPTLEKSVDYDVDWLKKHPGARGMVFPPEGYLPASRSIGIVGVRAPGSFLTAYVNGEPVPALNKRPSQPGPGDTTLETWKGVSLDDGANTIRLLSTNARGETLNDETVTVYFNDTVTQLQVVQEASILSSDGRTRPVVAFRLTNEAGIPLHPGTIATITTTSPHKFSAVTMKDGTREEVEQISATGTVDADGLLRLRLAPVRKPGTAIFTTFTKDGTTQARAFLATEGRPFVVVGLASGTASQKTIAEHMRAPGETALGELANLEIDGRTSLYAQGVVRGKWLLTARYDSGLAQDRGDFFDIDPDVDYIVYGDASTEGNAASSRDALYLRIEGDNGELLYGDFDTNMDEGVATYARRLTGARMLFGNDVVSVNAFLTDTSQSFVEDKFAADGTSGPFMLSRNDILDFSEVVSIETTSRTDPGKVIESHELTRGRDYDIDYQEGRIFLSEPLRSRDAEFNSNAVIVRYEVDAAGRDGVVAGARATLSMSDAVTIGATAVHEDNVAGSDGAGDMIGVDAKWSLNKGLTGTVALGYSTQEASSTLSSRTSGHSAEARLRYIDEHTDVEAYLRSKSTSFGIQNQIETEDQVLSAGMTASRTLNIEKRKDAEGKEITRSEALEGAVQAEHNLETGAEKILGEVSLARSQGKTQRAIGLRAERDVSGEEDGSGIKIFGTATHETRDGRLRYEIGQELTVAQAGMITQPDRGSLEIEYDATEAVTLKGSHEIAIDKNLRVSILGLGADVEIWDGGILSLGSMTASSSVGTHTVGHTGLAQDLSLSDATKLHFGVERQAPIAGHFDAMGPITEAGLSNPRLDEAFWALNAGFEHTGISWNTGGLAEYRSARSGDRHRLKLRAARTLREDLAFGAQAHFLNEDETAGSWSKEIELKASLAWRPLGARYVMLDQLRAHMEKDSDGNDQARLVNSIFYSRQLDGGHKINLRHGIKLARFGFQDQRYSDVLNLFGAEYRHQATEWLDFGLHGALLHSMQSGGTDYSAGVSVGFTPFENGWLSAGYNVTGFKDEDFAAGGQTAKGAFVQFRFKFDQESLNKLAER